MQRYPRNRIVEIASDLGVDIAPDWSGCGPVFPLLERMRADGATALIKLDGERRGSDALPYTVMVSGGPLDDEYFRIDCATLDEGLCHVIGNYADAVWRKRDT